MSEKDTMSDISEKDKKAPASEQEPIKGQQTVASEQELVKAQQSWKDKIKTHRSQRRANKSQKKIQSWKNTETKSVFSKNFWKKQWLIMEQLWASKGALKAKANKSYEYTQHVAEKMMHQEKTMPWLWILFIMFATVVLSLFLFFFIFFTFVSRPVSIKVPNVFHENIYSAVQEIQKRHLNVHISFRYTNNLKDKGLVLLQKPSAGDIVKVGRSIQLMIGLGRKNDQVGQYVGQSIEQLQADLKINNVFSSSLLYLDRSNFIYQYSQKPKETILYQYPKAGTLIEGKTPLVLVVSLGEPEKLTTVGDYVGQNYTNVLDQIKKQKMNVYFHLSKYIDNSKPYGVVLSQQPKANTKVKPNALVNVYINNIDIYGYDTGVLTVKLPTYPIYVDLSIYQDINGTKKLVFTYKTKGGLLSYPYLVAPGTKLIVMINGQLYHSYKVGFWPDSKGGTGRPHYVFKKNTIKK